MKRNLTLREKKSVIQASPNLRFTIDDWLIVKKHEEIWTLKHKYTDRKKEVYIA